MKLANWMEANRWTNNKFSKLIGCHSVTLSAYVNGRNRISKFMAMAIEKATNGEVTVEDLLRDNRPKNPIKSKEKS